MSLLSEHSPAMRGHYKTDVNKVIHDKLVEAIHFVMQRNSDEPLINNPSSAHDMPNLVPRILYVGNKEFDVIINSESARYMLQQRADGLFIGNVEIVRVNKLNHLELLCT